MRELLCLALYGSASIEAVLSQAYFQAINTWHCISDGIKMIFNKV